MQEKNNCLIIKYSAIHGKYDNEEKRCFVLDEIYSNKFKSKPINEIEISYPTSGGYDIDYVNAKLYFMEEITKKTYNEIKRLDLVDDENEIIELFD